VFIAVATTAARGTSGCWYHHDASACSTPRSASHAISRATASVEGQDGGAALLLDPAVQRLDLGVAGRVLEEHLPGEGMRLDVGEPRVQGTRQADLDRLVTDEMAGPDGPQVGVVALQEPAVHGQLGLEVVVEDGRRDAGASRDLVDRGPVGAALREEIAGGELDELASRVGSHPAARRWGLALTNLVELR